MFTAIRNFLRRGQLALARDVKLAIARVKATEVAVAGTAGPEIKAAVEKALAEVEKAIVAAIEQRIG